MEEQEMGKLLKYEWKKQHTTRMQMGITLVIGILLYGGGIFFEKGWMLGTSLAFLVLGAPLVLFYMGIESIVILNRDLKTKQSYMLWMIPKSVWEILGAKWIAEVLQMFFAFAAYSIVGLLCLLGTVQYAGQMEAIIPLIQDLAENILQSPQAIATISWILLLCFVGWTMIIMAGFLAVILSRTVLLNSKAAGFLSVVLFFIIVFIVERIYGFSSNYISLYINGDCFYDLWSIIYYILSCLGLFGICGWLADKKLSV